MFRVFHHPRVVWEKLEEFDGDGWGACAKNTNYLLEGFVRFIKASQHQNVLLMLYGYGPDIEEAKNFFRKEGVEDSVVWLSNLKHKEILALLTLVDVGCGRIYAITESVMGQGER